MTLPYELALELKNQGWKQPYGQGWKGEYLNALDYGATKSVLAYSPSLSELIGGCPEGMDLHYEPDVFFTLRISGFAEPENKWYAGCSRSRLIHKAEYGATPEEAVARLWLELQNNKKIDMASSSHVA